MKNIGSTLQTHLEGSTLTLADLFKVTRQDGQVFGFTSLDRAIFYDYVTYEANSAFSASAAAANTSMAVTTMEITGYLSSGLITQEDCEAGLWDGAAIEMWRVNYENLAAGHEIVAKGELGEVKLIDGQLVVELRGFLHKLQNDLGRSFLPVCDAQLGDARCAVSLSAYTFDGTVSAVVDRSNFTAADIAASDDTNLFRFGVVTWNTGDNAGRRMEVKEYDAGVFEFQLPMPSEIQVGDTFTAVAGCDKTLPTCRDTFSNIDNFRGFPTIPGINKIVASL